jgi:hypothetical protein
LQNDTAKWRKLSRASDTRTEEPEKNFMNSVKKTLPDVRQPGRQSLEQGNCGYRQAGLAVGTLFGYLQIFIVYAGY